ncbi:MAG: Nif3-like dinuclear metal center hexameric protein [Bacteroidetes bacterium]|jgi:dinuclear metal center YbgI/SA1388 family protein|nr:Nif3-like dinuclear metal center hexameric protein [Bacteroidota bacterium]
MLLGKLCSFLDSAIPLSLQEDYDNSGLQIGLPDMEIRSALISLDVNEDVVDEAIRYRCGVIISHHPLIFKAVKRLSDKSITERVIRKALTNNIAVYSAHTNLDMMPSGVSRKMAEKLDIQNIKVLSPLKGRLLKLITYIPEKSLDKVRKAVFDAGAGVIGNYDMCSFTVSGTGSFRGNKNTNPYAGERESLHFENEIRFETILFSHMTDKVVQALKETHPYEEVAYDIYKLENHNIDFGLGVSGNLPEAMKEIDFLRHLAKVYDAKGIRYSGNSGKIIKKVALCGGTGISLINEAFALQADAFITADIKYHNFFDAGGKILLIDIGHYESEKFAVEILFELIRKKFPTFALRFSEINTNPINYL